MNQSLPSRPSGLPPTCVIVCRPPSALLRPPCNPAFPCLASLLAPMSHLASFSPRMPNSLLSAQRDHYDPHPGSHQPGGGGDYGVGHRTSAQSRLRRRGGGGGSTCADTHRACTATNSCPHLLTDSPPPYPVCTHHGHISFGGRGASKNTRLIQNLATGLKLAPPLPLAISGLL